MNYPAGHILNPRFRYVPAHKTDLRETFKKAAAKLKKKVRK